MTLSFGRYDDLEPGAAVAVCHPHWRGVRTATYTWRCPVIECSDLEPVADSMAGSLANSGVSVVIVSGFPPGSADLLRACSERGIATRCVLHSSMAQHGAEAGEARVAELATQLTGEGAIGRLGFVKAGMSEAMQALGHAAWYVPNRAPEMPTVSRADLGPGLNIGVFAEPFWRKNVVTQLAAVALMDEATAHVMNRPDVGYLNDLTVVAHGEVPWRTFVDLQASTDLNLYVTLSECHPLSPVESYLVGVPSLVSRTSALFREDDELWRLTTVAEADDPTAIAAAAERLLAAASEVVQRARTWIASADEQAAARFASFISVDE